MVGWIIFLYATCFTLKHYPEKGGFYYPFFGFYTLWFLSGPVIIVLGNNTIGNCRHSQNLDRTWELVADHLIKPSKGWMRCEVAAAEKWVREKVVVGVEHCVALLGHTVFLVLTRPSAHNKNFPYHVRTTQIGIMEVGATQCTVL